MPTRREIGESICIWGSDDDELAERPSLEDRLRAGIIAYDGIVEEDRRWRREVAAGRMRYRAFEHGILMADFDLWRKRCPEVDARIRKLEMRGVEVAGAAEFRERCRLADAAGRALEAPPPRPHPSVAAGGIDDAGETAIGECSLYWTAEELRPVGSADLELLAVTGVIVHDALEATIRRWRDDLEAGRARRDPRRALDLEVRFLRWAVAFPPLEARIRKRERRGRKVNGAEELRERFRRALDGPPYLNL